MNIPLTTIATRNRYEAATKGVEAWAILDANGVRYGALTITHKATASGHMARAFFHLYGSPMEEGKARGGGYDMTSAALADALRNAWPAMAVRDQAQLEAVTQALEYMQVDLALARAKGLRFLRCI